MKNTRLKKGIVIAGTLVTLGIVALKFLPQSNEILVQEVVKKEEKIDEKSKEHHQILKKPTKK